MFELTVGDLLLKPILPYYIWQRYDIRASAQQIDKR